MHMHTIYFYCVCVDLLILRVLYLLENEENAFNIVIFVPYNMLILFISPTRLKKKINNYNKTKINRQMDKFLSIRSNDLLLLEYACLFNKFIYQQRQILKCILKVVLAASV